MRSTILTATYGAAVLSAPAIAFQPPSFAVTRASKTTPFSVLSSSGNSEIDALREKAAQLRKEAEDSAVAMGKDISSVTAPKAAEAAPVKSLTVDEVLQNLSSIDFDGSTDEAGAASQIEKMDELAKKGELSLWKAAVTGSANSGSPAPLRTFPVSLQFMESRTDGKVTTDSLGVFGDAEITMEDFRDVTIGVVAFSTVFGIGSLALLPENIGATLCYFFAIIPVLFIGIGSSSPGIIASAIGAAKGTSDDASQRDRRVCVHEAGHFLCGYLCGLPVKAYSILDNGFPCVEFHSSSQADGITARRELSPEEIAALSVVALSGSVAEVITFGKAMGGESDLIELDQLLRRSSEFIGAQKQQDLTRWGAVASYNLIKGNRAKFDKLVDAFQAKKSVPECIAIVEAAA